MVFLFHLLLIPKYRYYLNDPPILLSSTAMSLFNTWSLNYFCLLTPKLIEPLESLA